MAVGGEGARCGRSRSRTLEFAFQLDSPLHTYTVDNVSTQLQLSQFIPQRKFCTLRSVCSLKYNFSTCLEDLQKSTKNLGHDSWSKGWDRKTLSPKTKDWIRNVGTVRHISLNQIAPSNAAYNNTPVSHGISRFLEAGCPRRGKV